MEKMTYKEYNNALKAVGISYLSGLNSSAKLAKNGKNGVLTTGLYLAPANMSGYEVCPGSINCECRKLCLNGSGRAKIEAVTYGIEHSKINQARIKKTRLFFQNRELFMRMLCYEIDRAIEMAKKRNMEYSVRLNCTSDISEEAFKIDGKNILELYPNVQFYGYTKVPNRYKLVEKYANIDLTFSYSGENWDTCVDFLRRGINVAVVFDSKEMPISFRGYSVYDGNVSDLRYYDPKNKQGDGFIIGLEFHRPYQLYKNGKYTKPNSPFVIPEDSPEVLYAFKVPKSNELGE